MTTTYFFGNLIRLISQSENKPNKATISLIIGICEKNATIIAGKTTVFYKL